MTVLVLGLLMFLGMHSVRVVADGWRGRMLARLGEGRWKAVYSVLAIVGLLLIVWGYGQARQQPTVLWTAPAWGRHAAALATVAAFISLAAAYVPGNAVKVWIGHPMVFGVLLWAGGHLLANGTLADLLLFGAFALWALVDYAAARRRDRAEGVHRGPGRFGPTAVTVVVGLVAWAGFAFWAHGALIGVRPFG